LIYYADWQGCQAVTGSRDRSHGRVVILKVVGSIINQACRWMSLLPKKPQSTPLDFLNEQLIRKPSLGWSINRLHIRYL